MATRDWLAIKTEYITGEISLRDLAHKHEVPAASVMRVAEDGGWVAERDAYRGKMMARTLEMAEAVEIDVRRTILESFAEARRVWAQSRRKADDFTTLARLAASIVGLDTEHTSADLRLRDWRSRLTEEQARLVDEAADAIKARWREAEREETESPPD